MRLTRLRLAIHVLAGPLICLPAPAAGAAAAPAPKPSPPPASPQPTPKPDPRVEPGLLDRFLAGPLAGSEEIVFAARGLNYDGHWYANIGYYADSADRKAYGIGGKLYRLNLRTKQLTCLLDDPKGGVRDPQVHYNGTTILFSYRKGGTDPYHLYEIQADGSGLRQLTNGPYDDYEPTYVADGGIVFVSTRCKRWVNCWLTQVGILHRCEADGSHLRPISSNNDHDNTPWPLPDGRVLYMRWEYVDRSQVHYHHLWTTNPDGTGQAVYYGNLRPGIVMIDAKPIPGTNAVVAVFSPGHGRKEHDGIITVVRPDAGPDHPGFARAVNPAAHFRDPWAFSEDAFLVASGQSLLLMDGAGRTQEIFRLPPEDARAGLHAHEPRPLAPRPREGRIPPRVVPGEATGRYALANVHVGRTMAGVKPGEIRKLLVLETLPEPIHFSGGMEPVSLGGTFILERILGTVPVEPDGSAYFEAPALRSLFFVALDANDLSVKRMQSFTTVQPGETLSCIGCHEHRAQAPPASTGADLQAMRRPPSRIEPIRDVPDVIDFPRDIQPILDRHCLRCHDWERPAGATRPDEGPRAGGVILSGDRGPVYSIAYVGLIANGQVADGRNRAQSNYPPRTLGSSASPLMKKLDGAHYGVCVSPIEKKTIRLWIESGAAYPGTYAAVFSGMLGSYHENRLVRQDEGWPETLALAGVLRQRCTGCHGKGRELPFSASLHGHGGHVRYNLSRPEKSLMLLGPLAEKAGGYGTCRKAGSGESDVFASREDPGYQAILAYGLRAKRFLDEAKRFDMPGFRPIDAWVREMKRYGILPAALGPDDPIDPYAVERRYWESLWHVPAAR